MSNTETPLFNGSNPCRTASFLQHSEGVSVSRTGPPQNPTDSKVENMRFPKKVRFRKAVCKIYGEHKTYPFYRVCGYVAGTELQAGAGPDLLPFIALAGLAGIREKEITRLTWQVH